MSWSSRKAGLLGCLRQRQDRFVINPNSMPSNSLPFIISCGIRTVSSTRTASLALAADPAFGDGRRAGALFFALHRDNFIVTPNARPLIGTLPAFVKTTAFKAKTHANTDTPPAAGQATGN